MKRVFIVVCSTVFLLGLSGKVNATLIELTPVVDRDAWSSTTPPSWNVGSADKVLLEVFVADGTESRAALEFDISAIPSLPITQVTLSLYKVDFTDMQIRIWAGPGDGMISASDFDPTSSDSDLGLYDPNPGLNVFDLGDSGIECIQKMVSDGATDARILVAEVGTSFNQFLSRDVPSLGEGQLFPTLGIQVVPEPATMLLLGTGLVGLGVFGRKRFKK